MNSSQEEPARTFKVQHGVSVVIPVKNGGQTIGRALASVAQQTLRPGEVLIVDNGSTDDTLAEAGKWHKLLNLRILTCAKPGSAAARNEGIRRAGFSRIAFLDADDVWYPRKLEVQVGAMDREQARLCGTFMHYLSGGGRILGENTRFKNSADAARALRLGQAMPTPLSSVIVARTLIDEVGLFDESFRRAQDFEWMARIGAKECLLVPTQEPLVGYVLSGNSSTADSYVEQGLAADLVRERIRGATGTAVEYKNFVAGRIESGGIPQRLKAGQAYRRAGIHVGQREFVPGVLWLLRAVALDPVRTVGKLLWQSAGRARGELEPDVKDLFSQAGSRSRP